MSVGTKVSASAVNDPNETEPATSARCAPAMRSMATTPLMMSPYCCCQRCATMAAADAKSGMLVASRTTRPGASPNSARVASSSGSDASSAGSSRALIVRRMLTAPFSVRTRLRAATAPPWERIAELSCSTMRCVRASPPPSMLGRSADAPCMAPMVVAASRTRACASRTASATGGRAEPASMRCASAFAACNAADAGSSAERTPESGPRSMRDPVNPRVAGSRICAVSRRGRITASVVTLAVTAEISRNAVKLAPSQGSTSKARQTASEVRSCASAAC